MFHLYENSCRHRSWYEHCVPLCPIDDERRRHHQMYPIVAFAVDCHCCMLDVVSDSGSAYEHWPQCRTHSRSVSLVVFRKCYEWKVKIIRKIENKTLANVVEERESSGQSSKLLLLRTNNVRRGIKSRIDLQHFANIANDWRGGRRR